jgi:hypothetical protein
MLLYMHQILRLTTNTFPTASDADYDDPLRAPVFTESATTLLAPVVLARSAAADKEVLCSTPGPIVLCSILDAPNLAGGTGGAARTAGIALALREVAGARAGAILEPAGPMAVDIRLAPARPRLDAAVVPDVERAFRRVVTWIGEW